MNENLMMKATDPKRNVEAGMYNGYTTFCTVNGYGACSYCDQCNVCHMPNPFECSEWHMFFDNWFEWEALEDMNVDDGDMSEVEAELQWARNHYGYPG